MDNLVSKALNHLEAHKRGQSDNSNTIGQLKELLNSKEKATATECECVETLIKELEAPSGISSLGMGIKNPLPPRYKCPTHFKNIQPLPDDKNGLIHGAIIKGKNYDLVCKAFRWFSYEKIYYGEKSRGRWYMMAEEVAGVCDLFDKNGRLVDSWSTGQLFKLLYANTNIKIPDVACTTRKSFISGDVNGKHYALNERCEGFYYSNRMLEEEGKAEYDELLNCYSFEHEDSLMPAKEFYDFCRKNLYGVEDTAAQKTWLVDPEYNLKPTATNAFIINSPYFKVYESAVQGEILVMLPAIYRKSNKRQAKRTVTNYNGKGLWLNKAFKL